MSGTADKASGRVKQAAGDPTDNDDLKNEGKENEGKKDEASVKVKDKANDAIGNIRDSSK